MSVGEALTMGGTGPRAKIIVFLFVLGYLVPENAKWNV